MPLDRERGPDSLHDSLLKSFAANELPAAQGPASDGRFRTQIDFSAFSRMMV